MFFSLSGFLVTSSLLDSSGVAKLQSAIARSCSWVSPRNGGRLSHCWSPGRRTISWPVLSRSQNWRNIIIEALALKQVAGERRIARQLRCIWSMGHSGRSNTNSTCYLLLALFGFLGLDAFALLLVPLYAAIAIALVTAMVQGLPRIDHGSPAIADLKSWIHGRRCFRSFSLSDPPFLVFRNYIPKTGALLAASVAWIVTSFLALGGALLGAPARRNLCDFVCFAFLCLAGEALRPPHRSLLWCLPLRLAGPVQQLLLFHSGMKLPALALFAAALPTSYVTAWLSWTLVERPSLGLVRHRTWRNMPAKT